jgi:UPF0042 nucleotide-binding protein
MVQITQVIPAAMEPIGLPEGVRDVVVVTGPAGAGRTTAIRALEDLGFEAIDNMPLSLIPRLLSEAPMERPLALGMDPRSRAFDVAGLAELLEDIGSRSDLRAVLVYIDCATPVLIQRYSETRRRHPASPDGTPLAGIERDIALLAPLRDRAEVLIDTTEMTPHDLRAEIDRWFAPRAGNEGGLAISLQSFSFARGLPRGADMVIDCRFLRNPHWEAALRSGDGRDPAVAAFIAADPNHGPFIRRLNDLMLSLLPAYRAEGKSYFALAFGCTGGRHRSVAVAEALAKTLAEAGWRVSIRHRDLERQADGPARAQGVEGA